MDNLFLDKNLKNFAFFYFKNENNGPLAGSKIEENPIRFGDIPSEAELTISEMQKSRAKNGHIYFEHQIEELIRTEKYNYDYETKLKNFN